MEKQKAELIRFLRERFNDRMEEMKKILFINDELKTGGVTSVLFNLLNALDKTKYSIDLLALDPEVIPEDLPEGVRLIPSSPFFDVCDLSFGECRRRGLSYVLKKIRFFLLIKTGLINRKIREVRKTMALDHYDIEIAYKEGISTLFAVNGDAKRKYNFVHSDYKVKNYSERYMETMSEAFRKVDKNIAVSRIAKESFEEIFRLDNVISLHNLLNEERIGRLKQEEHSFEGERPVLLAVGRLHPQKAYDRLLRVAKRLNDDGLRYQLRILGDGDLKEKLCKQKAELSLDNVFFEGNQKNPFKYMANADLLVLASLYEGLPTVVSEALLCGLPVFSSEVAGIDELLNEDYGIVVKNDEESIYQGLRDLLMHPERIDQMKKALTDYHGNREEDLRKIEELFQ